MYVGVYMYVSIHKNAIDWMCPPPEFWCWKPIPKVMMVGVGSLGIS